MSAACRRGERALLFAYEESVAQIIRNMRSIGCDPEPWVREGRLQIHASRPTLHGLEQHLVQMHHELLAFRPAVVVVDPISNLAVEAHGADVKLALMRLIDFIKQQRITMLFTALTSGGSKSAEDSELGVSSLMDAWLLLRNVESDGERNRTVFVLKSRGMPHSNRVRGFVLSRKGIDLVETDGAAPRGLTGLPRLAAGNGGARRAGAKRQRP